MKQRNNICSQFTYLIVSFVLFLSATSAFAVVTDPDSGRSIEIEGIEDDALRNVLEKRLLSYLKNDDLDAMTELLLSFPMDIDTDRTTDEKLIYLFPSTAEGAYEYDAIRNLYRSLRLDDIELFDALLDTIPEIAQKTQDREHKRLMVSAVANNQIDAIQLLETKCADCDLAKLGGEIIHAFGFQVNPYHRPNVDTFKYLLDRGAAESYKNYLPGSSVVMAVADMWVPHPERDVDNESYTITEEDTRLLSDRLEQKYQMLELLFERGFSVNETDDRLRLQHTAISRAVENYDEDLVDFLLENGADPRIGFNPLFAVEFSTNPLLVKKLIAYGYDPLQTLPEQPARKEGKDRVGSGATVYTWLATRYKFNQDIIEIFSEYDIDINAVDSYGKTALDYRVSEFVQDEKPFTDFLIAKGAKKSDTYYYGAMIESMMEGQPSKVIPILNTKPELIKGVKAYPRGNLLRMALRSDNAELFHELLARGASIDSEENLSAELLNSALYRGHFEVVEKLVAMDAKVNVEQEVKGEIKSVSRALINMSEEGNVAWVKRLLTLGASTDAHRFHDYPLVKAASYGHTDVVRLLIEAGAKTDVRFEGKPLSTIIRDYGDNEDIVELLLEHENSN